MNLYDELAKKIAALKKDHPLLVAIDGVDGAGKSFFANNLSSALMLTLNNAGQDRTIFQSSVDFFHNPRLIRRPPQVEEWRSFYENSFNYSALKELLLDPLAQSKEGCVTLKYFDHKTDQPLSDENVSFKKHDILIFDGIFIHRPELRHY